MIELGRVQGTVEQPYLHVVYVPVPPARVFTFNLTRSWEYGLDFYLEREVPKWSPDDPNAALVLTTPQGLEEIRKLGRFQGALDEPYVGILYVPVLPAPR